MKYSKHNKKLKKNNLSKKLLRGGVINNSDKYSEISTNLENQMQTIKSLKSLMPDIIEITILNHYLYKLLLGKKCKIPKTDCTSFSSGASGQIVKKCGNFIYKGPDKNLVLDVLTSRNGKSFLLDPNTMNLLVQNVIKFLIENNKVNDVEHYLEICKGNVENEKEIAYYLKGDSYEYCPSDLLEDKESSERSIDTIESDFEEGSNFIERIPEEEAKNKYECFNSLESYLVENDKIDVDLVAHWLQEIFDTLDKLFYLIQFHHCDPKAAQIFLTTKIINNSKIVVPILGDLDKVAFTLKINNKPIRMKLITNSLYSLGAHIPDFTNLSTAMRYQDYPLKNNNYEKLAFLYSSCLLCNNLEQAKDLKSKVLEKNESFLEDFTVEDLSEYIWEQKELPQVKGLKNRISNLFYKSINKPQKLSLSYPLKFISIKENLNYQPLNSFVNINEKLNLELIEDFSSGGFKKSKKIKKKLKNKIKKNKKYTNKKWK